MLFSRSYLEWTDYTLITAGLAIAAYERNLIAANDTNFQIG